eukprot:SAG22_NODE_10248_length_545_cov_1.044843_1_plen_28_part_10
MLFIANGHTWQFKVRPSLLLLLLCHVMC